MKRYSYLDWMRVICAFGVIADHVLSHYMNGFPVHGTRWIGTIAMKQAMHYHIPCFFMISGALLIRPLDGMSYGQWLKKRFARVCIPFVFWSFVHWLVILVIGKGYSTSLQEFLRLLLCNGISSQYWYVYATLNLYLLLPFLGELVCRLDRKQLWTLIAAMAFISLLLPFCNDLLKAFSPWKITNYNLAAMGAYITFALTGYALNTAELPSRGHRMMIYLTGLLSWCAMNALSFALSEDKYVSTFSVTNYPLAGMMAVAVFVAVKALFSDKETPRFVSMLSAESYTAYLTHMMCLRLLQYYWTTARVVAMSPAGSAASMAEEFVLGTLGCFSIAWLSHKLPRVSRWL